MASPASNVSRAHETGPAAAGSIGHSPVSHDKPVVDLTAITTRDDFLLELGDTLSGQASVRPVDSISTALQYLTGTKRGQVLVIDTRDLTDVLDDVERAHSQAPNAVVLVFADTESEKQISTAAKGSNVFAVLPIPIDKRKTNAVLDGAIAEAVARKTAAASPAASLEVTVEPFQPQHEAASTQPPEREKSKALLWVGLGVAVIALAGGGYWFATQNKRATPTAVGTPEATASASSAVIDNTAAQGAALEPNPTVDTSILKGKVDDLLEKARLAMRERRYLDPAGDNALLYYRSAAAADPNNDEAIDGLQRVATVAASRFEESMNSGKYDEAALALANLKVASTNDSRARGFQLKLTTAQISKALADGNIDRASALVRQAQQSSDIPADQVVKWRADISHRQEDAKIQRLANLVSDRIRDGKLIDPVNDDAKTYVQQLRDFAPSNPTTQHAIRELDSAYLRKAREAASAKNNVEVDRWIAETRADGVSAAEIATLQRDLISLRQKAMQVEADRLAEAARDRIRDGRLTDPEQDSAAYYLTQLQATDPTNPVLTQTSHDLAAKLLDRAKTAALAGKTTLVDSDLTQAKRWGADPRDILAVQQTQPVAKPAAGPGGPVAAATLTPAQLAARLERKRYVQPEFPEKALTQRIGGSVIVEFTVDMKGNTRDVRVVEATPPGVFDNAATAAVRRWRYEPVIVNGAPVEVPTRMAIRFEQPSR